MKILIVPMAAMAETSGPSSRCAALAKGFADAGTETATCMAEDCNFRKLDGIPNYFLDIPMPMGMPEVIAKRAFPMAQKLGITSRKAVRSFDEVLHLTGNLDARYLRKSIASIRKAIAEYKPDIVYSEFNISALIAAKCENVKLCASVSYPTQHEYAHDAKLARELNKVLDELGLPQVSSALQLFKWADAAFCPSIPEMEPLRGNKVFFCGTFKGYTPAVRDAQRNKILVYMGSGTVSASKMLGLLQGAFGGSDCEIYFATSYLKEGTIGNIHIAPRWDFSTLLDESVLFIDHGGQNSIVDGLMHGVPQIIIPGKVFERQFNGKSVEKNKAGIVISHRELSSEAISRAAKTLTGSDEASRNAYALGEKLRAAGGTGRIIEVINNGLIGKERS